MRFFIVLAPLCPILSFSQQHRSKPPAPISPVNSQPSTLNPSPPSSVIHHPSSPPATVNSQRSSLNIGDTLPPGTLNYKPQNTNYKLLILDFWATWCTSCLKHFPQLDSFQRQYNGQVQVLLVNSRSTGDDEQKIKAFFQKRRTPSGRPYTFPLVNNDTVLTALFPHRSIPHYVWLDSRLVVRAITAAESLTADNISNFLKQGTIHLPRKADVLNYDRDQPLFQPGVDSTALRYSATFAGYIAGIGGGYKKTTTATHQRRTWRNLPLLALYGAALRFPGNRVVLDVADTTHYITGPSAPRTRAAYLFSYEISTPATTPDSVVRALMLSDLNRFSGSYGRMERRTVPCWVLMQSGSTAVSRLATTGAPPVEQWSGGLFTVSRLQNRPLSAFIEILNLQVPGTPLKPIVLDETGLTTNVDLELHAPLTDLPALRKELARYGLDLVPTKRELDVFILSEAPPDSNGNQHP